MNVGSAEVSPDAGPPDGASTAERLREIAAAPSLQEATERFRHFPSGALTLPAGRAYMHQLIRTLKPDLALEIGTFKAGTTELMVRALLENKNGKLITIDPFGNDRVPPILKGWPKELHGYVAFSPVNSMELFMIAADQGLMFDLVFIDGDHSYPYASFDLDASAKRLVPGGVIVLDDYDQPGVYQAAKDFLARNPGWEEIAGVFNGADSPDPFGSMRPSVADSGFLVLTAPTDVFISDRPASFESRRAAEPTLTGFALERAPGNCKGTLHANVFWRSFSPSDQEQLQTTVSTSLDASPGLLEINLPKPLVTTFDPADSHRMAEIVLWWQPQVPGTPLHLLEAPRPLLK